MFGFGRKEMSAQDKVSVLRNVLADVKSNGVENIALFRARISEALKKTGYRDSGIGSTNEISVTAEVLASLGLERNKPELLDAWVRGKDQAAVQKALQDAIQYAQ